MCSLFRTESSFLSYQMITVYPKKSETNLLPAFWKKIKNTQRVKITRFLIGQNKTKCANFRGNPLFESYVQHKNKQCTYLLPVWLLWEGRGYETEDASSFLEESNWQEVSELFVFVFTWLWKRGFPRNFAHYFLFCPTEKWSVYPKSLVKYEACWIL